MDANRLKEIVSGVESLAPHLGYLLGIARPCVDITLAADNSAPAGSRFGGDAYVPADFNWPSHDVGTYRFLGQINFGEIHDGPPMLPASGLLSLFYVYDERGDVFWGDPGYVLGFYWGDTSDHAFMPPPQGSEVAAKRITFSTTLDYPRHAELRNDWPFDWDTVYEFVDKIGPESRFAHLLGYPNFNTLAYDPTPGPEWVPLFTAVSDDTLDWCWHDGDRLMLFVEADKLVSLDFSNLKADAG